MHSIRLSRFIVLTLLTACASHAEKVSIRADAWYPYNGIPNTSDPGYMIELAQMIFEPFGFEVDYQILNWQRSVSNAQMGTTDCVIGVSKEEAPQLVFAELPWGVAQSQVYVKQTDPWQYAGLASFEGRRTGLILGYHYTEPFDGYFKTYQGQLFEYISGDNPLQQNIRKLLADRIQGMIETTTVMDAMLKKMGLSQQIRKAGVIGEAEDVYIACNGYQQHSQKIMSIINQQMPILLESGQVSDVLNKYGVTQW